jgi:hypothetical protein
MFLSYRNDELCDWITLQYFSWVCIHHIIHPMTWLYYQLKTMSMIRKTCSSVNQGWHYVAAPHKSMFVHRFCMQLSIPLFMVHMTSTKDSFEFFYLKMSTFQTIQLDWWFVFTVGFHASRYSKLNLILIYFEFLLLFHNYQIISYDYRIMHTRIQKITIMHSRLSRT